MTREEAEKLVDAIGEALGVDTGGLGGTSRFESAISAAINTAATFREPRCTSCSCDTEMALMCPKCGAM